MMDLTTMIAMIDMTIMDTVQSACNTDSCTDYQQDCTAGYDIYGNIDRCTCSGGLEARETGVSSPIWVNWVEGETPAYFDTFEYECCDVATAGARSDGTCGNIETDSYGCSQMKCTSPADPSGATTNCWAGTPSMGCTCSDGWGAVGTGMTAVADDGQLYIEYTCCPSAGSTDGTCGDFGRDSDEIACNQDACTNYLGDCHAGYNVYGNVAQCTCSYPFEARATGKTKWSWIDWVDGETPMYYESFEYECCAVRTGGAHRDGTCGHYETDNNGCTQSKCSSPSLTSGSDCYAGSPSEGCTCDDGWTAVETGHTVIGLDDLMYYEYTCCPSGGTTDGTCGDFPPTQEPTESPTTAEPTTNPSNSPTVSPSNSPSQSPSNSPSQSPSNSPSQSPSNSPSESPSNSPTASPSNSPTVSPSNSPSVSPSNEATVIPSIELADILADSSGADSDEGADSTVIIVVAVIAVLVISGIALYCGKCRQKKERIPSKALPMNPSQQAGPPQCQMVPMQQPAPPGVAQMVMGQNGQWMMQQPQQAQQIQLQQGVPQQQVSQQMQFVYCKPEGKDSKVEQAQQAAKNPTQQFQYNV